MQSKINTTPNNFKKAISEIVKQEISAQSKEQKIVTQAKADNNKFFTSKQVGILLYRLLNLIITIINNYI